MFKTEADVFIYNLRLCGNIAVGFIMENPPKMIGLSNEPGKKQTALLSIESWLFSRDHYKL